jgi:hypothetical protein
MGIDIVTKEDLQHFRSELLSDLKQTLSKHLPEKPKQWLKSPEVRRMLKISPGTLQNLRVNGTLRFTKIGGIIYYSYEDIELLLEGTTQTPSPLERAGVRLNQTPFSFGEGPGMRP